jgi:hypothetical protein
MGHFDYVVFTTKEQIDPKYNTVAIVGIFQVPSGGLV